jgi:hypothetical protein
MNNVELVKQDIDHGYGYDTAGSDSEDEFYQNEKVKMDNQQGRRCAICGKYEFEIKETVKLNNEQRVECPMQKVDYPKANCVRD